MSFTKDKYLNEVRSELKKELNLTNDFMIPRLEKVVLNCTTGDAMHDKKVAQSLLDDLTTIAGQKAVATKAKKSISAFKVREGADIGAKVTLRKDRMYEFLDRFIYMALPRTRDFRGLSKKGFDGKGNYSLGVKEQIVFFEINYDKIEKIRGLNITICTTARDDKEAYALLKKLNFPFNS